MHLPPLTPTVADRWVRPLLPRPRATLRLICFPHAGGSAVGYRPLAMALGPEIEVYGIQSPGRSERYAEPCLQTMTELADQAAAAVAGRTDLPTALFGHSLGGIHAFEVARRLEGTGAGPVHLFVSGRRAPSRRRHETVHLLPDEGILAQIRLLGGTGAAVLDEPDLMRLFLPVIRSDYRAIETYESEPGARVRAPITALVGDRDPLATFGEVDDWRAHTTGAFRLDTFEGGHFYLTEHYGEIAALIEQSLR